MRRLIPRDLSSDLAASLVVFLVAMPLCLGIALASGVPAGMGLISGIVGGIVVGALSGSPLQVTGPAAGLAVIVFGFVQQHGVAALGPVLLLAGLIQIAAGFMRMGTWFRLISPAVVHGMLTGIGILIVLAQIHVLMGSTPSAGAVENAAAITTSLGRVLDDHLTPQALTLIVGVASLLAMLGWERFRPRQLRLLPGALIGVATGTLITLIAGLPIPRVELPASILGNITLPSVDSFAGLMHPDALIAAVIIAVIASAETLLSASAVDKLHDGPQTKMNKELWAQGVGNGLCGLLGGLPITGVIVRSSANVQAGARTRASTILHGVWILALVALAPRVLGLVPLTALAAVLLVTGWRLVNLTHVRELFSDHGPFPAGIWAATVVVILVEDLLIGVAVGLALSLIEIAPVLRRRFAATSREGEDAIDVTLNGAATCARVPKLLSTLEALPTGRKVRLNAQRLRYIDHTSAEMLSDWIKRETRAGRPVEISPPRSPRASRAFHRMTGNQGH